MDVSIQVTTKDKHYSIDLRQADIYGYDDLDMVLRLLDEAVTKIKKAVA